MEKISEQTDLDKLESSLKVLQEDMSTLSNYVVRIFGEIGLSVDEYPVSDREHPSNRVLLLVNDIDGSAEAVRRITEKMKTLRMIIGDSNPPKEKAV